MLQDGVAHPQLAPLSVAFLVALLHGASRFELLSGTSFFSRRMLVQSPVDLAASYTAMTDFEALLCPSALDLD